MPVTRRIVVLVAAMCLTLAPSTASAGVPATAAPDTYLVDEGQTLTVAPPGVLANDSGGAGTPCVLAVNVTNLEGHLGDEDNTGWAADGSFTFTAWEWWNGQTSFTYDLGALSGADCLGPALATGTVTIDVTAVNDPPTAVLVQPCLGGFSVGEDSGAFTQADTDHCVELHDWGPIDEITQELVEWVVSSNHPELFAVPPSISKYGNTFGKLQFTPAPGAHGSATVTVRGRDDGGTANGGVDLSPPLTFSISINDRPTATADSFIVLKDRTLNVGVPGVLINDSDVNGDSITAVKVTNPAHGVVTLAADGSFSYTPATGYVGLDAFSYKASDGSLFSPTRVVSLTVTAVPPVATPTPVPTATPLPTPTAEVTAEPSPSATVEPSPSIAPSASPAESSAPSASPGASPTPVPASDEGGVSLPVLLVIVLFVLLVGFGAALYVPKWLQAQRGEPIDDDGP